jgi:polar amino acid transport system substrate-binding protein
MVYSSIGDPSVPKEIVEVFADGVVVQLEDFRKLLVTSRGRTSKTSGAQDKGQSGLLAAFLAATRGQGTAPIALSDLVAVTEATFAIEESLRTGSSVAVPSTHNVSAVV